MLQFLHDNHEDDDNDDAKAIAIQWVFSETAELQIWRTGLTMFSRMLGKYGSSTDW